MDKFTRMEWLKMLVALQTVNRFNIVIYLANEGAKTIEEVAEGVDLISPTKNGRKSQRWLDAYINPLLSAGLIDYADRPDYKKFEATDKAREVLKILLVSKPSEVKK
jgi:hypothetical protein